MGMFIQLKVELLHRRVSRLPARGGMARQDFLAMGGTILPPPPSPSAPLASALLASALLASAPLASAPLA